MAYPQRLLNPGESVVVDVRPHPWFLARPVGLEVVVIAGAIAAAVASTPSWVVWLAVAVLIVATGWLVVMYVRWMTTRLIVTTTRIIDRRGVLARQGREIPLSALSDIGYRQSLFGRLIGMGDVVLESAGKDSQEVFSDLPHPAAIHNEVYKQLEARRTPSPAPVPASGPPAASIPEQIDQLDQLRRRGVISDQEFEAKKADLLNRM